MMLQSRRNADHARLRPARKGEFSGRERERAFLPRVYRLLYCCN
ncbi:hypothetical protein E2986_14059 [Frieseomelitta varia]|uniref:Uncharacterized protein n=1 Tax=Frieseomelitta varia TaxID=561572 RepID=A0A833S660_9HYME|nr:hypothetical protein E2986_14059 [Frieseomelitta varia]